MENEFGFEPLVDDLSTTDEGFFTLNSSLNSSTESFVDIANLPNSSNIKPNVKTVIYPSAVLPSISHKTESKQTVIQSNLCGISSFQGFKMMTSSSFKIDNKFAREVSLLQENTKVKQNSASKENLVKKSVMPKCPAILKHKRREDSIMKGETINVSPIKPLSFSPSRFLNRSSADSSNMISEIKISDEVMKELAFSDCTFDIEDSGIGCSDGDATGPLSPPSLTSTPVSSRSRRKCLQKSFECLPVSPEQSLSQIPLQSTPKSTEENQGNKTPVICKFLHESTPRTPTPFKCPTDGVEDESVLADLTQSDRCSDFLSPERDSCFKKPSPVGPDWPARRWKASGKHRSQKTARKALLLEQEIVAKPICPVSPEHRLDSTPVVNLLAVNDRFPPLHASTGCEPSALAGNKTVTERRTVVSGKKSVYCTRRRKQSDKKSDLDKRWVAVACGHSFDQKVMTEAAKRCLRRNIDSRLTYFKKL